jgi:YfiH family protein
VAAEFLATGGGPEAWVPIRQVHGTGVAVCDRVDGVPRRADADAVVVTVPGRTGVILTADCAPVAVVAAGGVAAIHGGWRGLLAGVVSEGVDALRRAAGNPARAVLGACIRPCCYEFGVADLDTVAARFGPEVRSTTRSGAPALDVPAVVRSALSECGVAEVLDLGVCTACSPDSFSFRRDGVTGRQALLIAWTGAWP